MTVTIMPEMAYVKTGETIIWEEEPPDGFLFIPKVVELSEDAELEELYEVLAASLWELGD